MVSIISMFFKLLVGVVNLFIKSVLEVTLGKTYKTEFFPWYEETMNIMFEGFEEDYKIDEETERDMTSQTQL